MDIIETILDGDVSTNGRLKPSGTLQWVYPSMVIGALHFQPQGKGDTYRTMTIRSPFMSFNDSVTAYSTEF